jgi:hypothetical protein
MKGSVWEIVFSVVFIFGLVIYVQYNMPKDISSEFVLLKTVNLLFVAIVGLYIADKAIVIGTPLLSEAQSDEIFKTIKDTLYIILAYYFGVQKNNTK